MDDKPLSLEPAPEHSAFDYAMAVAKAGAIVFPFAGPGVVLFDLITTPLRGKRFSEWCEQLRLALNELSGRVAELTPAKLAASEEFNSAFAQAAQAAIKTHQQEKLEALRNALLNVALGKEFDATRQEQFLSLVDQFTTQHLRLLRFFDDPSDYFVRRGRAVPSLPVGANMLASQLMSRVF